MYRPNCYNVLNIHVADLEVTAHAGSKYAILMYSLQILWWWSQSCEEPFQKAKQALVEAHILAHYDPDLPISLAGDALAYKVGTLISHMMPDSTERPVAIASRTLSSSEHTYSQVEKEALSLVFGF